MTLLKPDRDRLGELLERVEIGRRAALDAYLAMAEIYEDRLYEITHNSWEKFCEEKWGYSERSAWQVLETAKNYQKINQILGVDLQNLQVSIDYEGVEYDVPALPAHASQVDALAKLADHPDRLRSVWSDAWVESHGRPTAKDVKLRVEQHLKALRDQDDLAKGLDIVESQARDFIDSEISITNYLTITEPDPWERAVNEITPSLASLFPEPETELDTLLRYPRTTTGWGGQGMVQAVDKTVVILTEILKPGETRQMIELLGGAIRDGDVKEAIVTLPYDANISDLLLLTRNMTAVAYTKARMVFYAGENVGGFADVFLPLGRTWEPLR